MLNMNVGRLSLRSFLHAKFSSEYLFTCQFRFSTSVVPLIPELCARLRTDIEHHLDIDRNENTISQCMLASRMSCVVSLAQPCTTHFSKLETYFTRRGYSLRHRGTGMSSTTW